MANHSAIRASMKCWHKLHVALLWDEQDGLVDFGSCEYALQQYYRMREKLNG